MHHALEIQEILLKIFHNFSPPLSVCRTKEACVNSPGNLAALARTCRAFKEPALDILWSVLGHITPLAWCLRDPTKEKTVAAQYNTFERPLTQAEWDTLKSYTHRIRFILDFDGGLDWESVATFLVPPTAEPLFPNLHTLCCHYSKETRPLLDLPLPSLVNLDVLFMDQDLFHNSPRFPMHSPNIEKLVSGAWHDEDARDGMKLEVKLDHLCRWQNLCSLVCPQITLSVDALVHLSRMPTLTQLDFALGFTVPAPNSTLVFPNLHHLVLRSELLDPIWRFLCRTQLPAITSIAGGVSHYPSKKALSSFFASVRASNAAHTIEELLLEQPEHPAMHTPPSRLQDPPLGFEDFQPCMAFRKLRHVEFNIEANVSLTDNEVLHLASAWPKLEQLNINPYWGWNTTGGITPDGLVRLLQTCRCLRKVSFRIDTCGYTKVPSYHSPESLGATLAPKLKSINVVDAALETDSLAAITAFFCGLAMCSSLESRFSLNAWIGRQSLWAPEVLERQKRWMEVRDRVGEALDQRFGACDGDGDDAGLDGEHGSMGWMH